MSDEVEIERLKLERARVEYATELAKIELAKIKAEVELTKLANERSDTEYRRKKEQADKDSEEKTNAMLAKIDDSSSVILDSSGDLGVHGRGCLGRSFA